MRIPGCRRPRHTNRRPKKSPILAIASAGALFRIPIAPHQRTLHGLEAAPDQHVYQHHLFNVDAFREASDGEPTNVVVIARLRLLIEHAFNGNLDQKHDASKTFTRMRRSKQLYHKNPRAWHAANEIIREYHRLTSEPARYKQAA